jgi:glycosyltransferase involved in cell wall biosynthesis
MANIVRMQDIRGVRIPTICLVENQEMQRWACENGRDPETTTILNPGVDTDRFRPPEDGWNQEGPLVSVGRLDEPRKGWDRLLRDYAHYRSNSASPRPLVLAGKGGLTQQCEALIRGLGLTTSVTILSDLADGELAGLLQGSSVFVQTSLEEGLGLAALEGQACGLPLVCTETAGSQMYVRNGETGYLISQDERVQPFEFSRAVTRILETADPAMSLRGRELCVQHFSLAGLPSRLRPVFASVMNS